MTDFQKLRYSLATGAAAYAAIAALYYVEGRVPNNALIGAAAIVAGIGMWHFLGRKK